jgi:hypothetical protein
LFREKFTLLLFAATLVTQAAAIRPDAAYNVGILARNDDGGSGPHNLGFQINLFGTSTGQIFVNNNGNITLGSVFQTFTPAPIADQSRLLIAPFWADVDTTNGASGTVTFGQSTVDGHASFGVNWVDVGYFPSRADKLNSFQLVMVNRGDTCPVGVPDCGNFDMEFNYDKIQWETGSADGGVDGLGGFSARVGYTNGGTDDFELAGSGANGAFLDGGPNSLIAGSFGSNVAGRYLFQVRNSAVGTPGTTQLLPILPNLVVADPNIPGGVRFVFNNVTGGQWFDPPGTYGFDYNALGGSSFSAIVLPTGYSPFTIMYGAGFANTLGTFNGGTIIDFVSLLGSSLNSFRVLDINPTVNSDNPNAFPTFINFVGSTGSFEMIPLAPSSVPEPSTFAMMGAAMAAVWWKRRAA